jgi:ketosteroid isomerase-like protein
MKTVDIEAEKKELLRGMKVYEDLENERDLDGIMELMTEDSVFVSRSFKHEGKENIREWFKGNLRTVVSSKHVPLRVEVSSSGDMAWLLGHETGKRVRDEGIVEISGDYMMVLRKVEGKWKSVAVCLT